MKIFMAATLLGSLICGNINAVLPPLYQTSAEIKAILESPDFDKHLDPGDVIETIQKTAGGYDIITNKRQIHATIEYHSQKMPGPSEFTVKFD